MQNLARIFYSNRFVIFALTFTLLIVLSACTDTLGTDPDVKITKLNNSNNGEDTNSVNSDTKLSIPSLWNFTEIIREEKKVRMYYWGNNINETAKKFIIDTSNSKITIWLNYSVVCTIPDKEFKKRPDRVMSFDISIDSLVINKNDPMQNYAFSNDVQAQIGIKKIGSIDYNTYTKNDLGFMLNIRRNTNTGNIEGFFFFDIEKFLKSETQKFQGTFEGLIPH